MQSAVQLESSRSWRDIVFAPAGLCSHARRPRAHLRSEPPRGPITAGVRAAIDAVMPMLCRPQSDVAAALRVELSRQGCAVEDDLVDRISSMLAAQG